MHRRPIRVTHLVPALFGSDGGIVGGAERYALELARHMADRVPTTLVSFGDQRRSETIGALRVEVIGNPWYVRGQRCNPLSPALFPWLWNAQVVHCHQQHVMSSSLAALFCRLSRRTVVVTDHGGGGWDFSSYVRTDRWYHKQLHVSEYSRRIHGQSAMSSASVILGGVDTVKFSPDDSTKRDGTVLFVGRFLPHKGVNDLLEAATGDMRLELIGPPSDARFVKDLQGLASGKTVAFLHDCADADVVNAYRRALCVVLPSVYRDLYGGETLIPELLGQTLLEAMACGTPVLCTNAGGMPEIVVDGVTGFVLPPNSPQRLREKLIWLMENPDQARRMGQAARKYILGKFTWPIVVERCLDAYSALSGRK